MTEALDKLDAGEVDCPSVSAVDLITGGLGVQDSIRDAGINKGV